MPWIRVLEESEAGPELREVYEEVRGARGRLSNIMQVQSLNPAAMRAHLELYMAVMFSGRGLSRQERELIAVAVSAANRCAYCVSLHAVALRAYWREEERVQRVVQDFRSADLSERERTMLEYAVTLTEAPHAVNENHIEALRRQGFRDEDILNINLITSYFNFVNRIAEGLGVEFTREEVEGYRY